MIISGIKDNYVETITILGEKYFYGIVKGVGMGG